MTSTLSFRVEDDIIDALDDAAAQGRISRSQLARESLLAGLEQLAGEGGEIDVPDHLGHDAKIKRLIASNKKTRREGKFRSEFSKQMKRSFKNNEHPAEFEKSVAGYIEEAQDMGDLPEPIQEKTDCRTFYEWVQDKLEYYTVAYQSSNYDADPIDNPLGEFAGMQDARDWMARAEGIAACDPIAEQDKRERLARTALSDGVAPDHVDTPDQVIEAADQVSDMTRQLEGGESDQ